jgi:hypothetical protein
MKERQFLKLLEDEANHQAKLNQKKILPDQLSSFASFFVKNMWKILSITAALMAFIKVYLV